MNFYRGLCILFWSVPLVLSGQPDSTSQKISNWQMGGLHSLTASQVSLTNWAAGGDDTFSLNGALGLFADMKNERQTWENSIDIGYGLIKQNNEKGFNKSDDKVLFETNYGYQIIRENTQWYFSGLLNFRTQFNKGFSISKPDSVISKFMSPAILVVGLGMDFKPGKSLSFNYIPLSGKVTVLMDSKLSELGAYGVMPGTKIRREMGSFFKVEFEDEVLQNVKIESKLELFTNYIRNFGNIDIDWKNKLEMNVNKWITVNYFSQLIYDDDIKIEIDKNNDGIVDRIGPRVQFKGVFGAGISIIIGEEREN